MLVENATKTIEFHFSGTPFWFGHTLACDSQVSMCNNSRARDVELLKMHISYYVIKTSPADVMCYTLLLSAL